MAAKESNIKAKENSVIDPNINVLRDAVNKLFSASYELRREFERGLKQAGDGIAENRVRIIKAEKRIEGIEGLEVRSLSPDAPVIIAKSPYTSLMEEAFHPSIIEKMKCDVMGELRYLPWWMDNKKGGVALDVDQREPWNMVRSLLNRRQFGKTAEMFWKTFYEMVRVEDASVNRCSSDTSCLACRAVILGKTVAITVDDVNREMGLPLGLREIETPYRSLIKRTFHPSIANKMIEDLLSDPKRQAGRWLNGNYPTLASDMDAPWMLDRNGLVMPLAGQFWDVFHEMVDRRSPIGSWIYVYNISAQDVEKEIASRESYRLGKVAEIKRCQLTSLQSKAIEDLNEGIQKLYPGAKCTIRIDTDLASEVMS